MKRKKKTEKKDTVKKKTKKNHCFKYSFKKEGNTKKQSSS